MSSIQQMQSILLVTNGVAKESIDLIFRRIARIAAIAIARIIPPPRMHLQELLLIAFAFLKKLTLKIIS